MKKSIFILFIIALLSSGCTQTRSLFYFFPDIKDYKKFPVERINPSSHQYNFKKDLSRADYYESLFNVENYTLKKVLKKTKSNSFLVFHEDTLVYEKYRRGYKDKDIQTVFSISKSVVSLVILDALNSGLVSSLDLPVCNFIPWLEEPSFQNITLENLLNMQSGLSIKSKNMLDLKEGPANFYYSADMMDAIHRLMVVKSAPNLGFSYEDINVQLLMFALEQIYNLPFTEIVAQRIWQPVGSEYPALWITDRSKRKIPYAYSGLSCTPIDLAKIGMLLMNDGQIERKIYDKKWVDSLRNPDNDDPQVFQKWLWWHNVFTYVNEDSSFLDVHPNQSYKTYKQTCTGDVYAEGFRGQFIYVYPEKKLMIIRTGKRYEYEYALFHNPAKRKFRWQPYFYMASQHFDH